MDVELISHASLLLRAADVGIWSDPWLEGRAFNNSWTMTPAPAFDDGHHDDIDFIWISHEHPDHFSVPTLRNLPDELKRRVTVLFQETNSDKIFDALRSWGFDRTRGLPHATLTTIAPGVEVYCYQAGFGDSALAVRSEGRCVLNVNDAELDTRDCRRILDDVGPIDIVANQFSLAGTTGQADREHHLPAAAEEKLERLTRNHRDLEARATLPFASFIYFSCDDNRYINGYMNTPDDVAARAARDGVDLIVLHPGDRHTVGTPHDNEPALDRLRKKFSRLDELPYDPGTRVELDEVTAAYESMMTRWRAAFPEPLLRRVKPVTFHMDDIDRTVEADIAAGTLREVPIAAADADVVVRSQPLHYGFAHSFGLETLGVSARLSVQHHYDRWQTVKRLSILDNAEIHLRPRRLFSARNRAYLKERLQAGVGRQVLRRLRTNRA